MNPTHRPNGIDTDADPQAHLAEPDVDAAAEESPFLSTDAVPVGSHFQQVIADIETLRSEIHNLRSRIAVIRLQSTKLVTASMKWADASAHVQLGSYPWAKLVGAMVATFVGTRVLQRLPIRAAMTAMATAASLHTGRKAHLE